MQKTYDSDYSNEMSIAVIGMAGRFPGAGNVDQLWDNICRSVESITFFSNESLQKAGVPRRLIDNPAYVPAKGVIDDHDMFDAMFFGYTPKQAELMDPQHRLFLEHAWTAFEHAGYNVERDGRGVGVYAGVNADTYQQQNIMSHPQADDLETRHLIMLGNDKNFLVTKISYKLNLTGPSVLVQSACSTSLVAVHQACQALLSGECDMALTGGVSIRYPRDTGYLYQEGGISSPDGHCRAFDADANGTIGGDGIGLILLKRLTDAIADRDNILAVIRASAINNDGSDKVGYMAPSVNGQAAAIERAIMMADVHPETIGLIEAHGTGTNLGDPIEIAALTQCYRKYTQKKGYCAIGSVKTNVGHLDTAAGVTGLIKAVSALKHRKLPPSLHYKRPNPETHMADSPFYVNADLRDWQEDTTPRRAAVSSFGMGGTNAHVILEEAPIRRQPGTSRKYQLITLSAYSPSALDQVTSNLANFLVDNNADDFADIAYTLKIGRKSHKYRRVLVCRDKQDAIPALTDPGGGRIIDHHHEPVDRHVSFLLPGQGAQYPGMGRDLYDNEPVFRQAMDDCCSFLKLHLDSVDLRDLLYADGDDRSSSGDKLKQTMYAQPALFVVSYAMAKLWMSWGVVPDSMIGHSIGEYVAATLSGVFDLESALSLVAARGRLMQSMPAGSMLAVPLPRHELEPKLEAGLSIAAVNELSSCVVSGPSTLVEQLMNQLELEEISSRPLHTSHAFHSESMEPVIKPFADMVGKLNLKSPETPFISNVTGRWITDDQATDPGYWSTHLRRPVLFAAGLEQLFQDPARVLLETGPGRTLTTLASRHTSRNGGHLILSSMRHPNDQQADDAFTLTALGRLWLHGVDIDWCGFYQHEARYRVACPTYPFERKRFWIEPTGNREQKKAITVSTEKDPDLSRWFYVPNWKRRALPLNGVDSTTDHDNDDVLVFSDTCGLADDLITRLRDEGHRVYTVNRGNRFTQVSHNQFEINPAESEDYISLIDAIRENGSPPNRVVHLWSLTTNSPGHDDEALQFALEAGYHSLICLAQALGKLDDQPDIRILVVTNNMQEVIGGDLLYPINATLLGPCKVIPREYPNVQCRSVDIDMVWSPADHQDNAQRLLRELSHRDDDDDIIAYRGRHRWVQGFDALPIKPTGNGRAASLRDNGVYLITGGLGGIGLTLAKYLADTCRARLVLIGRSAFPQPDEWRDWLDNHDPNDPASDRILKLLAIEQAGGEVMVVQADIADETRMREVVSQVVERFGHINGVIHSAGVPDGAVIQARSRAVSDTVLRPKLAGTFVLERLLRDMPPDFMILCSSLSSVFGPTGQVAYTSANAFLDAYAGLKNSSRGPVVLSIGWDTWQEVGMAVQAVRQLASTATRDRTQVQREIETVDHPLFEHRYQDNDGSVIHVSTFTIDKQWVLNEHRISGKSILPGTTYIEMIREAYARTDAGRPVELSDVYYLRPLVVEPDVPRTVHTVISPGKSGTSEFVIMSRPESGGEPWVEHFKGSVEILNLPSNRKLDINAIRSRCNTDEAVTTEHQHTRKTGLVEFGPRWQCNSHVHMRDGEGIAFVTLPSSYHSDIDDYLLHPATLDVATAFMLTRVRGEHQYLPFMYKRVRIMKSMPAKVVSHITYSQTQHGGDETLEFDIVVTDEKGSVVIELDGYTLRLIDLDRFDQQSMRSQVHHAGVKPDDTESAILNKGIQPSEGMEVFHRVLDGGISQVYVSTYDFNHRLDILNSSGGERAFDQFERDTGSGSSSHDRPELETEYVAPGDELELAIAQVWQELLGINRIGRHDDFFELGGDSLVATQIISRLRKNLGVELPIASLFEMPTVSKLAERLRPPSSHAETDAEPVEQSVGDREEIEI